MCLYHFFSNEKPSVSRQFLLLLRNENLYLSMATDYSNRLLFGIFTNDTYSIFSYNKAIICMVYGNNLIPIIDLLQSQSILKHPYKVVVIAEESSGKSSYRIP